jgi:hypothetical protein
MGLRISLGAAWMGWIQGPRLAHLWSTYVNCYVSTYIVRTNSIHISPADQSHHHPLLGIIATLQYRLLLSIYTQNTGLGEVPAQSARLVISSLVVVYLPVFAALPLQVHYWLRISPDKKCVKDNQSSIVSFLAEGMTEN